MPPWRFVLRHLAVALFILSAIPAVAETSASVARHALAVAWEGRLEPRTHDAKTGPFEQSVRALRYTRCVRVDSIEISTIAVDADRATLQAGVAIAKRAHGARVWSPPELVSLRIEMRREQNEWRIAGIRNRDEELADRLLGASAGERRRILDEDPARITKGLARALYARALASLNAGKFAAAGEPAVLAKSIAIEAGDLAGEALATALEAHVVNLTNTVLSQELSARAVAVAQLSGDPDALARAWYDFGRLMHMSRWTPGDPPLISKEIAAYQKAVAFGERAEDPTTLLRALYSLGNRTTNT